MGPLSFDSGDYREPLRMTKDSMASMGPLSFDSGDPGEMRRAAAVNEASMGPLSFDSGDAREHFECGIGAVQLQWGRCLSTAETAGYEARNGTASRASMGPLSFDSGDHPKPPHPKPPHPASMGPLSFDSGDGELASPLIIAKAGFNGAAVFRQRRRALWKTLARRLSGFNGAAVFRQRRPVAPGAVQFRQILLQWGRCLSTAETTEDRADARRHDEASMGPLSFDSGDRAMCPRCH